MGEDFPGKVFFIGTLMTRWARDSEAWLRVSVMLLVYAVVT